ncbi:MAG TPA: glycosyltransferase [Candidatus Saccharimonadales bacterium]|nr:glycosyltransferase [Candidatus Saccharimonadales bacterium]
MKDTSKLKIALVCDWLTGIGGAERVVLEIHKLFPEAPIYTSQYDPDTLEQFADADVRTGRLQKLPKSLKKFLPVLRAWYFSHLDLTDYDLVISISGAEAKSVKTSSQATHISYIHSPTHYYWIRYDEYLEHPGFPRGFNWLARLGLKLLIRPMQLWDFHAAQQPDYLIANSTHTKMMIEKYYKRTSTVIFPPVEVERFKLTGPEKQRHGFVTAGRQTPYKRIDLAVAACSELNVPLVVIGNGPEHKKLEKLAGRSVIFLTNVNDMEMAEHFQTATGFIFPTNVEDFGVTAVEAMAAGTPVIAYQEGGPKDYIIPNKTGLFFDKLTVKNLVKTLEGFKPEKYDAGAIAHEAQRFSVQTFTSAMRNFIKASL